MVNIIMVPPSNVPPAPPLASPNDPVVEMKPSEAHTLKEAFEEIMVNDKRCVGLSKYIVNVRIFWSRSIPTACAGHGFIFFNPDFWDSIPSETRITVMVHEIWHLILKHLERGKKCDPYVHNHAADHVINNALEDDGFTFEGTSPYKDPKYKNKSTEQVYNAIYEDQKKNQKQVPGIMEGHVSAETIEGLIEEVLESENKTLEEQKKKAEADVDKASKGIGSQTGNQGIRLDLTNVRVAIIGATYNTIFKDFLTDPLSSGARTFMRPNRRQIGMGKTKLILPGRFPKKVLENRLGHLTYALDVSGSITSKQAQQFHDSVRTIKELLNPALLTVLFFDTRIVLEKTFNDKQKYGDIQVNAGGGTCLLDVYKRTAQLGSDALVIFTDLCVTIPPQPSWECIWLIPEKRFAIPAGIYGEVYLIPETK